MMTGLANAQFAIGHRTISYVDASRSNRSISTEVYYPGVSAGNNVNVANGQFPVVVIGHGFSMSVSAYQNWWEQLVPQGYIVMLPTTEVGPIPFPSHPDFGLDIAFVAAQMQAANTNGTSPFYNAVTDRTGFMGHSMGGGCSILAAANNPMVDCIVGLAPAETNTSAIAAGANVTAPALILWGTEDEVTPEAGHALGIYNGLASECKDYVRIDQGAHCFFANYNFFCATGEMNIGTLSREEQQQVAYSVAIPWLDYFLKDDCAAFGDFELELATNPDLGTNIIGCSNTPPVISDNGGMLTSDAQPNYQWYLDGQEIPNADQQTLNYSTSGTYQVASVVVGNCPVYSNEIVISPTGIEAPNVRLTQVDNAVTVSSTSDLENVVIEEFDLSGRQVSSISLGQQLSGSVMQLPIQREYRLRLIRLRSDEASKVWRLFY
jgi:dienelactone hydrolase